MCRFLRWKTRCANVPAGARPLPAGIVSIGPAFHHELLPLEAAMLLPSVDTNLALLSALEAAPERFAGLAVGLFLSDPFLNIELAIRRLRAAGVTWVAALPSACQHEPEFRQYLREVDLDLERELRVLSALFDAGILTIATVSSAADAAAAGALPTAVLVLPSIGGFVDGFPSLAARRDLERIVSCEAREPASPLRLGVRRRDEATEADGLHGVVLRPEQFES